MREPMTLASGFARCNHGKSAPHCNECQTVRIASEPEEVKRARHEAAEVRLRAAGLIEPECITMHVSVSVDIDRFGDAKLEREWLPMFPDLKTVAELREACAEARAAGLEAFPNPECKSVKPNGMCGGCES